MRSAKRGGVRGGGRVGGGRGGRWAAIAAAVAAAAPGASRGAEVVFTDTTVYSDPVATTGAGANAFILNVPLGATTKQVVYTGPSFTASAPADEVVKLGLGVFFQASPNTYTGRLVVGPNGGTFDVRGGGTLTSASAVVVNQSSFFNVDNQNAAGGVGSLATNNDRLGNAVPIFLAGGRFQYLGRNTTTAGQNDETVGTVTLNQGQSEIRADRSGGNGANLTLSGLARDAGGTVRFTAGGTIGQSGDSGRIFVTGLADNAFVGGWAVVNSGDFANYRTAQGVGNYGGTGFTAYDAGTAAANFTTGKIVNQSADVTNLAGTVSVGALRMSGGATRTLAFTAATDTLFVETGGVLSDGANNARAIGGTTAATRGQITAGSASATGPQELFFHNNSNTMTVNAVVINNPANGGQAVTVVKDLDGTVSLAVVNSYTGGTIVNRGTLTAAAAGSLGNGGAAVVKNARLNLNQAGSIAGTGGGYTLADQAEVFLNNTAATTGNFNAATDRFTVPAGSTLIGGLGGAAGRGLNSVSRVGALTGGGQVVLAPDAIVGHSSPQNNANNGVNDAATGGTTLNTIGDLGAASDLYFGLSADFNAGGSQGVTLGTGTPWKGMSTDRGGDIGGGVPGRFWRQGTITLNGDVTFQGLLRDNTYATLVLGDGNAATNGTMTYANAAGTAAQARIVGRVNLNEAAPSMPSDLTFRVTPGGTLLLSQANALGGDASAAANAKVIVEGGATLDPGNVSNAISGDVALQAGSTLLLNDNVAGGPLNGAGAVTMSPGSFLLFAGSPAYNAFVGPQIPTVPAGVVVRLNGNTSYGGTGAGATAVPSSQAIGLNGFSGTNAAGTAGAGKAPENVVVEVMSGTNNTITSATGVGTADNLYVSGATLTSTVTGGTLSQGGGRLIVGPGGLTLAGGASISPANTNNSGATFTLQEDYDLPAAGRTLTIGSAGSVSGVPKANSYVGLTSQGARGVIGSNVNITSGAQLQLSGFYVVPDLSTVTVNAGTSLLVNFGGTETIGALAGTGPVASNNGSAVLQVGYGDQDSTYAGSFVAANTAGVPFASSALGLTKIGAGTLTLTGASTATGTMSQTAGTTVLTGGAGLVKFPTVQLNRGTLVLDNAGGAVANRLGGVGGATPSGPNLRLGGGNLTLTGGGNETLGNVSFDGGGVSTLSVGTGTLNVVAGSSDRSVTTVILRGTNLGAGGGAGTFTTNRPNLSGTFANNQVTTGVRPDVLSDTPATGGAADLAFTTYDPAAGFRRLNASEYTAQLFPGQNLANNLLVAAPQNLTFPVAAVPGQLPTFGADTTFQSVTFGPTGSIAQAATPTSVGGQTRVVISSNGVLVPAGVTGASISAPYVQNTLYATTIGDLAVSGQITNGSLVKAGPGTLTLGAGTINNVDGNIAVNDGRLVLGANSRFFFNGTTGYNVRNTFLSGGTLDLAGNSVVAGQIVSQNFAQVLPGNATGNIVNTGAPADLTVQGNGGFNGTIAGVRNLTKFGNNTWTLHNTVDATGDLTVRAGTVSLVNAGRITGVQTAALNVGVLSVNNVDSLNFGQRNDYAGPATAGERFPSNVPIALRGAHLQFRSAPGFVEAATFGNTGGSTGVGLELGSNQIQADAGGNGSAKLTIGNLVRDAGSRAAVNFTGSNLGNAGELYQVSNITLSRLNGAATVPLTNNIIGAWAVANGSQFATANATGSVSNLGNTGNGYAGYNGTFAYAATVTDSDTYNLSVGATTEAAGVTARVFNTLRLNAGAAATLTLNAGQTMRLRAGGLISDVNGTATFTGGSITAGTPGAAADLYVWTNGNFNNGNGTTMASVIADNGGGAVTLVKAGGAPLTLTAANTHTGGTVVHQGTLTVGTGGSLPAGGLTLNGNVNNVTTVVANTAGQIAAANVVTMNGGAVLRLNDTAAGNSALAGLVFNNIGGGQTPTVQIAGVNTAAGGGTLTLNGDVTVVNDHFANVPTISQSIGGTAATTPVAVLDLGGAARTFDVGGQSVLGLNVQAAVQNGGIVKTGPGTLGIGITNANLVGGASTSTLTGGITINAGTVRVDSPGALGASGAGGNTVTVNPGGTLLGNVNGAVSGNVTLAGGTLRAITSTPAFTGNVTLTDSSTVNLQDFFLTTTNRGITLNGPIAVNSATANPTLSVAAITNTGSQATLTLGNSANNFVNAGGGGGTTTLAIAPNAFVTAQSTTTFGSTINGALINMTGGRLNLITEGATAAQTNATITYGNAVTVSGPAQIHADRVTAVTGNTVALGGLVLGSTLTTSTGSGGYTVAFTNGTILTPGSTAAVNATTTTVLGALSGVPASFTKFGGSRADVASWGTDLTASAAPVTIAQGTLRTTTQTPATANALTTGPLVIHYGGTLENASGSGKTVNYAPSSLTSEGLIRATNGVMNLGGRFLTGAGAAAPGSQVFSPTFAERFTTAQANDAGITFDNAANLLNTATPLSTANLTGNRLQFSDAQISARARTAANGIGAAWTGTFAVGGGGANPIPVGPVSFGLASDDGATLYVDYNRSGTFEAGELVIDNRGGHGTQTLVNTTPSLAAGTYAFAVGYWNGGTAGNAGNLDVRYYPGVMGAGVTPTPTNPTGGAAQQANGFQPVPFANQFIVAPSGPMVGNLQVDSGATMITGGFNVENVRFNSGTLRVDNTSTAASVVQVLYAEATSGTTTLDVAGGRSVEVGQAVSVNAGGTLRVSRVTGTAGTASLIVSGVGQPAATHTGLLDMLSDTRLSGSGTVGGGVRINAGATLAPGSSPGVMTVNSGLTFTGGTLEIEIGGPTAGNAAGNHDQIDVLSGNVALGDGLAALVASATSGYVPAADDKLFIIDNQGAGTTSGYFAGLQPAAAGDPAGPFTVGGVPMFVYYGADAATGSYTGGNDVMLSPTFVPEPTTTGLLAAAAVGLLARRRRGRAGR